MLVHMGDKLKVIADLVNSLSENELDFVFDLLVALFSLNRAPGYVVYESNFESGGIRLDGEEPGLVYNACFSDNDFE